METKEIECKIHGLTTYAKRYDGRFRCRKCSVEGVNKRRRKVKAQAVAYLGGSCSKCGYDKSVWALDFHHTDPDKKLFTISGSGHCRSWEKIKEELSKCILLCKNCHAEKHEEIGIN